jgi:Tol biopolymer transport system component
VLPESESGYQFDGSFSPDGKTIYYRHRDPRQQIYRVSLSGPTRPQLVLGTDSGQFEPRVSPDGKWLAFVTGDSDIHMLNLVSGEQIPVTNGDYWAPRWRGDGRELFCVSRQKVVSITPGASGEWNDATVTTLFTAKDKIEGFDVAPDGQSILLSEWTPGPTDRLIHVVMGSIPR